MPLAVDNIRVGKKYRLINQGEVHDFIVMERLDYKNFMVKDVETLEEYELEDLIRWGQGKDYDLVELF